MSVAGIGKLRFRLHRAFKHCCHVFPFALAGLFSL